ncbi:hypothetical protein IM792_09990 [Mucilaginibacter sp. JRF]|uniref:hypothetical protein n=1 Tax=Mucilaginibacter sp. JRF TaxID=2780088 RepID=UPI00187EA47B|nr:hypothetical protein [Mucilaginibacter sp. JRF]MBE9584776.1 hypothetical protein [Mucilaginibacter sp. JRF]
MEQELKHYEFINLQTGNVISYISLPASITGFKLEQQLAKKKTELAINNQLYLDLIYWQDHDHCIR